MCPIIESQSASIDISGPTRCVICRVGHTPAGIVCPVPNCDLEVDVILRLKKSEKLFGSHRTNLRIFYPGMPHSELDDVVSELEHPLLPRVTFNTLEPRVMELFLDFAHNQRFPTLANETTSTLDMLEEEARRYNNLIAQREIEKVKPSADRLQ